MESSKKKKETHFWQNKWLVKFFIRRKSASNS